MTDILLTPDANHSSYNSIFDGISQLESKQDLSDDSIYYDYYSTIRNYISAIEKRNTYIINYQIRNNKFSSDFDFSRFPTNKFSFEIVFKTRRIRLTKPVKVLQFQDSLPRIQK